MDGAIHFGVLATYFFLVTSLAFRYWAAAARSERHPEAGIALNPDYAKCVGVWFLGLLFGTLAVHDTEMERDGDILMWSSLVFLFVLIIRDGLDRAKADKGDEDA